MKMLDEFKSFLIRSNALALAIGVIFGAAAGKIVSNVVDDLIMPVISLVLPGAKWDDAIIKLGEKEDPKTHQMVAYGIKYGHFIGGLIEFVVIAFVLYLIAKFIVKEALPAEAPTGPAMKDCPFCKEAVLAEATKCKYCGSSI